jgi:hypothetical protein
MTWENLEKDLLILGVENQKHIEWRLFVLLFFPSCSPRINP